MKRETVEGDKIGKNQVKEFGTFPFSMYGKMQESGLTEIIPFICTSAIWASILCFPQCSLQGVAAASWLPDHSYYFPSWLPLGLRNSHLEGQKC